MTYLFNDILLPWSLLVAIAVIMFVLRKSRNQWQDLALAWALAAIGTGWKPLLNQWAETYPHRLTSSVE